MLALAKMKFSFVNQVPFLIWRCSKDLAVAQRFIDIGRRQVASRDPRLNRITAFFVCQDLGCMGRDFDRYVDPGTGNALSPELQTEFTAYESLGLESSGPPYRALSPIPYP